MISRRSAAHATLGLSVATALVLAFSLIAQPTSLPRLQPNELRAPTPYIFNIDLSGVAADTVTAPSFSGADVGTTVPVVAVFSTTCTSFYYRIGGTAAAPAGDNTAGTASARNPTYLMMAQGAQLSIFSSDACDVMIEWYLRR